MTGPVHPDPVVGPEADEEVPPAPRTEPPPPGTAPTGAGATAVEPGAAAADADGQADGGAADGGAADDGAADGGAADGGAADDGAADDGRPRRRRDRVAAALIGVLTLLLGFAFAVQVRSTDTSQQLPSAREEDLVRILDNINNTEERLRSQIADQRAALAQLTSSDSRSATALAEARSRAAAISILDGTVAAQGPGLRMVIRDPAESVRVADLLDAIEELRGAGAETMQIDDVRVGVSTAVTGDAGALRLDGHPLRAPYEVLVIGAPQALETAVNIPGGVVQRITGQGGSVEITQQQVVVDALRPLDRPQYASPRTGG